MAPLKQAPLICVAGVLSYNNIHKKSRLKDYISSIADPFVNGRRERLMVGTRPLHDFVPLYWSVHTPMQYVVTIKRRCLPENELIFFEFRSDEILSIDGVLSTDGNVASWDTETFDGDGALDNIDWDIVDNPKCISPEWKRKKQAEVLVPERIPAEYIHRVVTQTIATSDRLEQAVQELTEQVPKDQADFLASHPPPIEVDQRLYYNKPM
jgi:hypothetical protein